MIHPETHKVRSNAVRPARPDGTCLYCRQPLGGVHLPSCVLREKTVVIRSVVQWVTTVPEDWDISNVEFHLNESSSCANNIITYLNRWTTNMEQDCMCGRISSEFVRDATKEDEVDWGEEFLNARMMDR